MAQSTRRAAPVLATLGMLMTLYLFEIASAHPTRKILTNSGTSSVIPIRSPRSDMTRGVNIGSWLLLEKWMVSDLFEGTNATDQ